MTFVKYWSKSASDANFLNQNLLSNYGVVRNCCSVFAVWFWYVVVSVAVCVPIVSGVCGCPWLCCVPGSASVVSPSGSVISSIRCISSWSISVSMVCWNPISSPTGTVSSDGCRVSSGLYSTGVGVGVVSSGVCVGVSSLVSSVSSSPSSISSTHPASPATDPEPNAFKTGRRPISSSLMDNN